MIKAKHLTTCLIALTLLSACAAAGGNKKTLKGERISVLELQKSLEPDDTVLESQGLITPPEWKNTFWPQAGGYPNHSMQNLALPQTPLKKIWSTRIGKGSTEEIPLNAQPILIDGTVYTLDTKNKISAINAETGKILWETNVGLKEEDDLVIAGGVASSGGIIYVTNGYNEILALRPKDGGILWRKKLTSPSRAAPTVLDGRVFVTTLDNKLNAFSTTDGSLLWEYRGIGETAGLIGAASPAAGRDIVIPVFSSGEITALRVTNGSVAWSDNLSNLRQSVGLGAIADIDALPVIDKGLVISVSFSGRMVAIEERSGSRIWQREISSSQTPWIAGNHVFVLSSENQLIALGRETGVIRWVTDLPRDRKGEAITFTGPILAGGRLIVAGTKGKVIEISPETGEIIRDWDSGDTIHISPIVAGGTLYILDEKGTLSAYR